MPNKPKMPPDHIGLAINDLVNAYIARSQMDYTVAPDTILNVIHRAGINPTSYYRIIRVPDNPEKDERSPMYETVRAIMKAIGLTVCDLELYRDSFGRQGGRGRFRAAKVNAIVSIAAKRADERRARAFQNRQALPAAEQQKLIDRLAAQTTRVPINSLEAEIARETERMQRDAELKKRTRKIKEQQRKAASKRPPK